MTMLQMVKSSSPMTMITKLISLAILVPLLAASSCARVTDVLGLDKKNQRQQSHHSEIPISCPNSSQYSVSLVGPGSEAQQAFKDFLRKENPHWNFKIEEQIVLWTLFQMKVRPDFATPTSRLQFISRTRLGTRYWDFTALEEENLPSYPFFRGLNTFLSLHGIKRPLHWYASMLDRHFGEGLPVEAPLEEHLLALKEELAASPSLRQFWFRGDELLQVNERIPTVSISALLKGWTPKVPTRLAPPPFFTYRRTPKMEAGCNYDLTLYDNSIFLIDKEENQGHLFGIGLGQSAFLAVASQTLRPLDAFPEGPVLKGNAKVRSTAFCLVQRQEGGEIWLAANQSRDPGQHVYHLFRYGLGKVQAQTDLERLLRHARHMFLSDPLRLVIESSRSREDQIRELLKLNIPIYNAQAIGNIWAWARFPNEGGRFYIDDRNPGSLLCSP